MSVLKHLVWALVATIAAGALGLIAQTHGEPVNSMWLVIAAVCTYLIGYRFHAKFIAARVMPAITSGIIRLRSRGRIP